MMKSYPLYKEPLRPKFHFTPRYWNNPTINPEPHDEGWMNDINGLTFLDGEYHFFAQRWWSCWLHAVSKDLVHWEELPPAFGKDEEFGGTQSGSAVIDYDNTSGLATGKTPVMVAFWSSLGGKGQCISYSNDKGRSWNKYNKNPVLLHPCRDPKVFRYNDKWIMLLYGPEENGVRYFSLFSSKNLLEWTKLQSIPGFYECPDMFELPVDGCTANSKWVIVDGNGQYVTGTFDGIEFKSESEKLTVDYGRNFYATMSWGDIPGNLERRIQVAWMRVWNLFVDMPFSQQASFPCELKLCTTSSGIRLFRMPIPEIEKLYTNKFNINETLIVEKTNLFDGFAADVFDAKLKFDLKKSDCKAFKLIVRGHYLYFDISESRIHGMGSHPATIEESGDTLDIRILSDLLSVEIFVNGGKLSFTNMVFPVDYVAPLRVEPENGKLYLMPSEINEIGSMWDSANNVNA